MKIRTENTHRGTTIFIDPYRSQDNQGMTADVIVQTKRMTEDGFTKAKIKIYSSRSKTPAQARQFSLAMLKAADLAQDLDDANEQRAQEIDYEVEM